MFFFKRKNKHIPIEFSDDYLKVPLGLEENNTIYWDMNSYRNFYVKKEKIKDGYLFGLHFKLLDKEYTRCSIVGADKEEVGILDKNEIRCIC